MGNLLIKVHGEIPVLDGSALEFCKILEEVGVAEQDEPQREVVIDRRYEVNGSGREGAGHRAGGRASRSPTCCAIRRRWASSPTSSRSPRPRTTSGEIAPARTFGFMKDLKMLNELGLGSGGRLDNFILVGEDEVVNTELRFPDEFVRHKILDIIGDLYLLGYPDPRQGHRPPDRPPGQHRAAAADRGTIKTMRYLAILGLFLPECACSRR